MPVSLFPAKFRAIDRKNTAKETASIVKYNCQTWVYLQADDKGRRYLKYVRSWGKYTTSAYQLSSQHGRYVNPSTSSSISLVARDLLTTDEIRRYRGRIRRYPGPIPP